MKSNCFSWSQHKDDRKFTKYTSLDTHSITSINHSQFINLTDNSMHTHQIVTKRTKSVTLILSLSMIYHKYYFPTYNSTNSSNKTYQSKHKFSNLLFSHLSSYPCPYKNLISDIDKCQILVHVSSISIKYLEKPVFVIASTTFDKN